MSAASSDVTLARSSVVSPVSRFVELMPSTSGWDREAHTTTGNRSVGKGARLDSAISADRARG